MIRFEGGQTVHYHSVNGLSTPLLGSWEFAEPVEVSEGYLAVMKGW